MDTNGSRFINGVEARGPIQQNMILAIAFTEAIAIYSLVVAILILFVL